MIKIFSNVLFAQQSAFKLLAPATLTRGCQFAYQSEISNQEPLGRWRIVKGDKVTMISGYEIKYYKYGSKDKGKQGTVLRVYRKQNRMLISGINIKLKRMSSQSDESQLGGVRQISQSVHVSKVSLIDPSTGKATKTSFGFTEEGKKVRISRSSGNVVEKLIDPAFARKERHKNKVDGIKDNSPAEMVQITYAGEDFQTIKAQFLQDMQEKERREKLLVFKD